MSITTQPPGRAFSFTDHSTRRPSTPQPGDRLDREFDAIYQAISTLGDLTRAVHQTAQIAYEDLSPSTIEKLKTHLAPSIAEATRQIASLADVVNTRAHSILADQRTIQAQLQVTADRVSRSETAARTAVQTSVEVNQLSVSLQDSASDAANSANDAELSANQARLDQELAGAWAEYMPNEIPAHFLANYDITGQHWSSRWWANRAASYLGGQFAELYLGAWPEPPTTTSNGDEIPLGAIYYNTVLGEVFIWNGTEWVQFYAPTKALMLTLSYAAAANQTTFPLSTPDRNGQSYEVSSTNPEPLDIYVNGARLPRDAPVDGTGDWDFDPAINTLTFLHPLLAGSIVMVDILSPASAIAPSRVQTQQLTPFSPIDGTTTTYPLTLAATGATVTVSSAQELFVSVDGIVQQPGLDYNVSGSTIVFGDPPLAGARAWAQWFGPGTSGGGGTDPGPGGDYLPLMGGTVTGPVVFNAPLSGTAFGWAAGNLLPPLASIGGANVALNVPSPGRLRFGRDNPLPGDFGTLEVFRSTTSWAVPTGTPSTISSVLRGVGVCGVNDGTTNWGSLFQNTTSSTQPGAGCIGGAFQGIRAAGNSATWAAIINVIDQTNNASSVSPGSLASAEIDLRASGADDGVNITKFGGLGLRQLFQMRIVRQSTAADFEVSTGIWFCNDAAGGDQAHNSYLQMLGCQVGARTIQMLDTRGAVVPTGYTDPLAAVRMSAGHIIDFNGGPGLKSNAGNYFQYTTSGTPRLRYMKGATELWSVSDTGAVSGTGGASVSADVASKNVSIAAPYDAYGADTGNFGNTAGGYQALAVFVGGSGHNNTAFGQSALATSVSTLAQTAVGSNALAQDIDGSFNTAVGSNAGWVIQSGFGSTALGHGALGGDDFTPAPNIGGQNTALGGWSGQEITTGSGNTFVGASSGLFLTTGSHNLAVGAYALAGGAGSTATAIGNSASYNVAVGESALRNTTVSFLTAVGWEALKANTTGLLHAAVGRSALSSTVADTRHTAFGANAAQNVNGVNNVTAFGAESQKNNTAGADNTTVGSRTASVLTTGQGNTILGNSGGFVLTTGAFNLLLGNKVGSTTLVTGSNNILIGINQNCDTDTAATSNTFRVTGATTTPIIDAINTNSPSNPLIRFPGSIQIGVPSFLSTQPGELGFDVLDNTQIVGSGAPGAIGAKLLFKCGTNPGTAALVAKAGTSGAIVTIFDNIGSGVAGC